MSAAFKRTPLFHQWLGELSPYPHCALVIEANYSDFLNPSKMPYFKPCFVAIAKINASEPGLSVVFAGNMEPRQEWILRFFGDGQTNKEDTPQSKPMEMLRGHGNSLFTETRKSGLCFSSEK